MIGLSELHAHLHGPALFFALAAFGLLIGILTGLFGVGGGFLVTPLLKALFGISYPVAVGSSLSFILGTGASGFVRHWRLRNVDLKAMMIIAGGSVCGSLLGVKLLNALLARFGENGKVFTLLLNGSFIVILTVVAVLVYRDADRRETRRSLLQRLPLWPTVDLPETGLMRVSLIGLCLVGLGVGMLTGLLGIGGGVILMPVLMLVVGLPIRQAIGTSLGITFFSAVAGTIKHGLHGNVCLSLAMGMLIGSTLGIQVGAWLSLRIGGERLRRYFSILILVVVAILVGELWHALRHS